MSRHPLSTDPVHPSCETFSAQDDDTVAYCDGCEMHTPAEDQRRFVDDDGDTIRLCEDCRAERGFA